MSFERQLEPAQLLGPKGAANAALSLKAADATSRRCSMPGLRIFINAGRDRCSGNALRPSIDNDRKRRFVSAVV
ncbi:MAG TPA: hypothetical protein VJ751_08965 [Pyrinomonadaceae bacterium]|nr:hypothetical protein [Pyrinomonadaceae bacterium]